MQIMVMRILLIVIPVFVYTCEKEDPDDFLTERLQNTSWKYDKLVITDIDGNIELAVDFDTTLLSDEIWTFKGLRQNEFTFR